MLTLYNSDYIQSSQGSAPRLEDNGGTARVRNSALNWASSVRFTLGPPYLYERDFDDHFGTSAG